MSFSLSLYTLLVYMYAKYYIYINNPKNYPHTYLYVYIYIYIIYTHIVHDRWYSKWPRSTDPANYCRYRKPTVCRSFSLQMCLPYLWQFNYGNLLDSNRPSCQRFPTCLRESSSQHKICYLLIKPCPHACFLRGIAFVNWSDPFSIFQAICGINGDTRGIPQMDGS